MGYQPRSGSAVSLTFAADRVTGDDGSESPFVGLFILLPSLFLNLGDSPLLALWGFFVPKYQRLFPSLSDVFWGHLYIGAFALPHFSCLPTVQSRRLFLGGNLLASDGHDPPNRTVRRWWGPQHWHSRLVAVLPHQALGFAIWYALWFSSDGAAHELMPWCACGKDWCTLWHRGEQRLCPPSPLWFAQCHDYSTASSQGLHIICLCNRLDLSFNFQVRWVFFAVTVLPR